MRKITSEATSAFNSNLDFKKSNTRVSQNNWLSELFLFGNLIARQSELWGKVYISNWGYKITNTTMERLNWLLEGYFCKVKIIHWTVYLINNQKEKVEFRKGNNLDWVTIF